LQQQDCGLRRAPIDLLPSWRFSRNSRIFLPRGFACLSPAVDILRVRCKPMATTQTLHDIPFVCNSFLLTVEGAVPLSTSGDNCPDFTRVGPHYCGRFESSRMARSLLCTALPNCVGTCGSEGIKQVLPNRYISFRSRAPAVLALTIKTSSWLLVRGANHA